MPSSPQDRPTDDAATLFTIADRLCTWCQVTMMKRLVADGKFIHYTCPRCIFQHTSKREPSRTTR